MPDDGVLGFEGAPPGQQTGHLVLAQCPAWAGFVQCDFCKLPRTYPAPDAAAHRQLARWGVNQDGELRCGECRRGRYGAARGGPWYTVHLRVFRPGGEGKLPQRVVPRRAFAEAGRLYKTKAQQNTFLLGYAAQLLDDDPRYRGAGGPAHLRAWVAGRTYALMRRPVGV